ncbi:hypothetical protein EW145_g783 [Phellinidium pouzarii]|uniref:Uncharacterized protein n=1 Tax=Phellinidium pouzarii TaxID=167371 RepID=A0A4S4LHL9_9AGAM|nr:hypothetical protein EW145_g783 [Phellinidium pouzarii]
MHGHNFLSAPSSLAYPFALDTEGNDGNSSTLRSELPTYNRPGTSGHRSNSSRARQSHEYSLHNANGHHWVTLRFKSWAPSAKSLPVFFEDQTVSGQVELDLQKPKSIKSVEVIFVRSRYTPLSQPETPSTARQQVYQGIAPILGPLLDPSGWHAIQDLEVTGTLFRQREVTAIYGLALAIPLNYTRGSVISLYLIIRSSDRHALDLLSTPQVPRILLRRRTTTQGTLAQTMRPSLSTLGDGDSQPLAKAIWTPAPPSAAPAEQANDEFSRSLLGELDIPLGCTPSFEFGSFNLQVGRLIFVCCIL